MGTLTVMTITDTDLRAARDLLERCDQVVPHTDADGLAAGALALRAKGWSPGEALLLARGETPWSQRPDQITRPAAILDWGIRSFSGPALFVDHHAPEASPDPDQVLISGYGATPETTTAGLMAELVPQAPRWVAAIGAVGDLGDRAWDLPVLAGVTKSHVKKLVPLINAPRRLPDGPVREALAVLVENETSRDALADARLDALAAAKEEWRAGFKTALRVAPDVQDNLAVIRFRSPYQVHPLVATTWSRRLSPNLVLAANEDYLPGMINFSVRGGKGDLRAILRAALPNEEGEFAHGHDRATGGSLTPERFERLIIGLRTRS